MTRKLEAVGIRADYIMQGQNVYEPSAHEVQMNDPRAEFFDRPAGFYSDSLRQGFTEASARIGGAGGGGLTLAVMLAKEGVSDFSVADIDRVDASNVGRIPMLTPDHIGKYKVDVAAELITTVNKNAIVRIYGNGVQKDNVDEFVGHDAGNKGLTAVFDEIDLNAPEIALILHRAARKYGRYTIAATDVERGGLVTTFDPNSWHTFERYMGTRTSDTEEQYLKKVHGFQLPTIPNIPRTGALSTLKATLKGAPLPTTLRSVLVATDLAMDEFEKLMTKDDRRYGNPHIFPAIHCSNPSQGEDFVTRLPRVRSLSRIVQLGIRDMLRLNPPANYSEEDRQARIAYRRTITSSTES